jgi:hypothetical protein
LSTDPGARTAQCAGSQSDITRKIYDWPLTRYKSTTSRSGDGNFHRPISIAASSQSVAKNRVSSDT